MMLNVTALITGYESVGDHTEFVVQVSLYFTVLSLCRCLSIACLDDERLRTIRTTLIHSFVLFVHAALVQWRALADLAPVQRL